MRSYIKWIAIFSAGAIVGLLFPKSAPQQSPEVRFAAQHDEFLQAWRALSTYNAAALNLKERSLQALFGELAPINGSSLYNLNIHRAYSAPVVNTTGMRVLEIGPGINLGSGLAFVMMGAEKYYGLDLYKDPDLFDAPQYESIVQLLRAVSPEAIKVRPETFMKVSGGQVTFDSRRIEYLYPRQSYDIRLPDGSLDYVFSNATFEHILDPQRTVDEIARALVKGGMTAHQIDLRDHRNFSAPLTFLKLDAATWKGIFADPARAHEYMNRWRASDFKAAFERAGFNVLEMRTTATAQIDKELRASLHPDFRNYSDADLSIVGLFIVAQKPTITTPR